MCFSVLSSVGTVKTRGEKLSLLWNLIGIAIYILHLRKLKRLINAVKMVGNSKRVGI